jgi:hypothetical protein
MKKKILAVACGLTLLVAVSACKKKQEQPPVPQTGMPGQQQQFPQAGAPGQPPLPPTGAPGQQHGQPPMTPPGPGGIVMPKGETTITLPDAVKGKWKAVVLEVEDKTTKKTAEYTVNLNSDFKIPNSNLKITVGAFLPDFKMNGVDITSTTNEPNNPAVGVKIFDGSNQVFPAQGKKWGWLYARPEFRSMHPFENPKYGIVLKSGVKKG